MQQYLKIRKLIYKTVFVYVEVGINGTRTLLRDVYTYRPMVEVTCKNGDICAFVYKRTVDASFFCMYQKQNVQKFHNENMLHELLPVPIIFQYTLPENRQGCISQKREKTVLKDVVEYHMRTVLNTEFSYDKRKSAR